MLPRKKNTDKTQYGHVLMVAGSVGMAGAALLTARAALSAGSGLVTLGIPKSLESTVAKALPEALCLRLPETKAGSLSLRAFPAIVGWIKRRKIRVLGLGPGLSVHAETSALVRRVVRRLAVPVVLDADGLNGFKGRAGLLRRHPSDLVLTPHRREFERLFLAELPEDPAKKVALAKKISKFYDVVLVLKGHRTLVVYGDRVYVNTTGNPGMAKGGAGDVLTGMIVSFIGQGLTSFQAGVWAAYFHGKSGDLAVRDKGELGILAGDLLEYLPRAVASRT